MRAAKRTGRNFLSGWKEIANYLGLGVRTVQRYESEFGLPVRRTAGHPRSAVLATTDELEAWIHARAFTRAGYVLQSLPSRSDVLSEFRKSLREMREHRAELASLRTELKASLAQIKANLRSRGEIDDELRVHNESGGLIH